MDLNSPINLRTPWSNSIALGFEFEMMAMGSLSQSVGLLADAAFVPASSCLPKEGLTMRMGFPPHAIKFASKSLRTGERVYEVPPSLQRVYRREG
jgi:hypothetical protein